jgi:high-affinity Fe2+/Pb2+ permease
MASATVYEMQRVGGLRLQIHFGLFAATALAWMIYASSVATNVGRFPAWLAMFAIALRSLANALDILDAARSSSKERDSNRLNALERWVHVDSLLPPVKLPHDEETLVDEPNMRVLEPTNHLNKRQ